MNCISERKKFLTVAKLSKFPLPTLQKPTRPLCVVHAYFAINNLLHCLLSLLLLLLLLLFLLLLLLLPAAICHLALVVNLKAESSPEFDGNCCRCCWCCCLCCKCKFYCISIWQQDFPPFLLSALWTGKQSSFLWFPLVIWGRKFHNKDDCIRVCMSVCVCLWVCVWCLTS